MSGLDQWLELQYGILAERGTLADNGQWRAVCFLCYSVGKLNVCQHCHASISTLGTWHLLFCSRPIYSGTCFEITCFIVLRQHFMWSRVFQFFQFMAAPSLAKIFWPKYWMDLDIVYKYLRLFQDKFYSLIPLTTNKIFVTKSISQPILTTYSNSLTALALLARMFAYVHKERNVASLPCLNVNFQA